MEKIKVDGVWKEVGGSSIPDTAMSGTSTNAVQNKVIKAYVDNEANTRQSYDTALGDAIDALDSNTVHKNGDETVTGTKVFNLAPVLKGGLDSYGTDNVKYSFEFPNKDGTVALAEDISNDYLAKSGGQLTGSITHAATNTVPVIKGVDDSSNNAIAFGGTDYNGGASLWLGGKDDGVGGFGLDAYNGTNRVSLVGRADVKKLYWNEKQVITNEPDTFTFTPNSGVTIGHFDGFAFGKIGFMEFANINSTASGTVQLGNIPTEYGARWNQWDSVWSSVDGTSQGLIQVAADGRIIAYAVVANKSIYASISYPLKD